MKTTTLSIIFLALTGVSHADLITVPDGGWYMEVDPPNAIPNYYFENPIGQNDLGLSFWPLANEIVYANPALAPYIQYDQCHDPKGCVLDPDGDDHGGKDPKPANTPEPGTLALIGAGFIGLAWRRWRR